ncbi:MAG TPA: element excision factor XisH family protein [Gemmataceae bacterium]|nr:element excision factor XisH family protein [Gemmataceae bacterium]
MPAKDTYHGAVRNALVKDGWTITHDPFTIAWDERKMYADLGAEQFLAAERSNRRIAVEIKSFLGKSLLDDLEKALGQFILYRTILERIEPDREMLLAIPYDVAVVFNEPLGLLLLESNLIRAFSFDPVQEVIVQWIP